MKNLFTLILLLIAVFPLITLAEDGSIIKFIKQPYSDYREWVFYMGGSNEDYECKLKNLSKNGSSWIIECPDNEKYRINKSFKGSLHFKITKEGEKSGYISESGYFIHTDLNEIKPIYKGKLNQWRIQGTNTILSATFTDFKEWKGFFYSVTGSKEGQMVMSWPFPNLKEIKITDNFPATTEKRKRHKFLAIFATIFSTITTKH
jgi:hypothetical protein